MKDVLLTFFSILTLITPYLSHGVFVLVQNGNIVKIRYFLFTAIVQDLPGCKNTEKKVIAVSDIATTPVKL